MTLSYSGWSEYNRRTNENVSDPNWLWFNGRRDGNDSGRFASGTRSGLRRAANSQRVNGISFTEFSAKDVVRHPLVQRIVEAYDSVEAGNVIGAP